MRSRSGPIFAILFACTSTAVRPASPGAPGPESEPAPPPIAGVLPGHIPRAALVSVLDAGPGAFLSEVQVRALLERGRFAGWKLISLGRFASPGLDLQAGDVVLRVNQTSLERPEHLQSLWQALRSVSELEIERRRATETRVLRFPVVD